MSDDVADAVLFQFKARTEERLTQLEAAMLDVAQEMARKHEDVMQLRLDIARTQRTVLEVQSETRSTLRQLLDKMDELTRLVGGARNHG